MVELLIEMALYLAVTALLGFLLGFLVWGWGRSAAIEAARLEGKRSARTSMDGDQALREQYDGAVKERKRLERMVERQRDRIRQLEDAVAAHDISVAGLSTEDDSTSAADPSVALEPDPEVAPEPIASQPSGPEQATAKPDPEPEPEAAPATRATPADVERTEAQTSSRSAAAAPIMTAPLPEDGGGPALRTRILFGKEPDPGPMHTPEPVQTPEPEPEPELEHVRDRDTDAEPDPDGGASGPADTVNGAADHSDSEPMQDGSDADAPADPETSPSEPDASEKTAVASSASVGAAELGAALAGNATEDSAKDDGDRATQNSAEDTPVGIGEDASQTGSAAPAMPSALLQERPAEVDNLKLINGVGPVMEKILNDKGVYLFHQVANFSNDDVEWINTAIDAFPGRVRRDGWVEQAQALYREKYGQPHDAGEV